MSEGSVRAAVYGEFGYRTAEGEISSDESFALFLDRLADFVDRLVLVGRYDERSGHGHHRLSRDVDFIPLPGYPSLGRGLAVARATAASIPRLWRALDHVDVVWLLGPNPICLVFAMLARLRGRRVVLGVRQDMLAYARSKHEGVRGKQIAAQVLDRAWKLLARRHTMIAVGSDLASQYAMAERVVPILVSLIEDGDVVGPEAAASRSYEEEVEILSVGRLERQKNPLLLVDIIRELTDRGSGWRLLIVGSGAIEEEVRERVGELGVSEAVQMVGYLPVEGELQRVYRSSDIFLHVSWTEGFPQVLLEAFAAGLPVVATAVGGIETEISECALLIPPGDAGAAVAALERLASEDELRGELIKRGRRFALRHTAGAECRRVAAVLRGG